MHEIMEIFKPNSDNGESTQYELVNNEEKQNCCIWSEENPHG